MVSAPSAAFWRENLFAARFSAAASAMAIARWPKGHFLGALCWGRGTAQRSQLLKQVLRRALGLHSATPKHSRPSNFIARSSRGQTLD